MIVRLLGAGDEAVLEQFLLQHRDTSMFLRSNVRQAGLEYRGQWAGAEYMASFDGDAVTGVAGRALYEQSERGPDVRGARIRTHRGLRARPVRGRQTLSTPPAMREAARCGAR